VPVTDEDILREKLRRERQRRAERPGPLEFRGSNLRFMEDGSHELMLSGPAETGKSTVACAYLHHLLSTTPRARGVMLRKTRASLMQTVHETYKSVVARSNVRVRAYGGEDPQWYDYPHNGSRLYLGGMDNAQKILSGERDFIYVCQAEDLVLQEWETLTTRATGRAGATDRPQVFGDCNPGPPTHWILHRPALKIIESRHVDNPRLYHADGTPTEAGARTMAILDALTGVLRARLFEGRWVAAEGLVYSFDKGVHLIDPFPIPPEWPRHMAIDFGFTNPFVALWFCVDPDARVHLYRQHYRTKMLVSDHGELIKRVERWLNADGQPNSDRERVIVRLADHDAEDRATLAAMGLGTMPAPKSVRPGIEAVEELLKKRGDGRPGLYIHRDRLVERDEELYERRHPISIEQEFDVYAYPKAADGKPQKEAPVKMFDHAMDPLRYYALWRKQTGGGSGGGLLR
jgi:Phage terminase large subunit